MQGHSYTWFPFKMCAILTCFPLVINWESLMNVGKTELHYIFLKNISISVYSDCFVVAYFVQYFTKLGRVDSLFCAEICYIHLGNEMPTGFSGSASWCVFFFFFNAFEGKDWFGYLGRKQKLQRKQIGWHGETGKGIYYRWSCVCNYMLHSVSLPEQSQLDINHCRYYNPDQS